MNRPWARVKELRTHWGKENSDPAKVAQLILRLTDGKELPAHLLIGSNAVQYAGQAEATRAQEAERWRDVASRPMWMRRGRYLKYDSKQHRG